MWRVTDERISLDRWRQNRQGSGGRWQCLLAPGAVVRIRLYFQCSVTSKPKIATCLNPKVTRPWISYHFPISRTRYHALVYEHTSERKRLGSPAILRCHLILSRINRVGAEESWIPRDVPSIVRNLVRHEESAWL